MNRKFLLKVFCVMPFLFLRSSAAAESLKRFTPHFNLEFSESIFAPSNGDIFTGGLIDFSAGLETKISSRNKLYAVYMLNYSGGGFEPQDDKNFQEKNLSHNFNAEWKFDLFDFLSIRPGAAFGKTYRRFGTNETFENGLYNTNSKGFHLAADYGFSLLQQDFVLSGKYMYRHIEFPNYTDLFSEFQNANISSEISGGLQNQNLNEFSVSFGFDTFNFSASHSFINFTNQKVLNSSGEYSDKLQKDTVTDIEVSFAKKLGWFVFYPSAGYKIFKSNQNYLRFKYIGAVISNVENLAGDVTYIDDNYSFDEVSASLPIEIIMQKNSKWSFFAAANFTRKKYASRPARDADNNYKTEKQVNSIAAFSLGAKKRLNEITTMSFNYGYTMASSNNKFERYIPYNYTGHSFGLSYNISF